MQRCISLYEIGHCFRLILNEVVHATWDQARCDMVHPFARRPSATLGINFAKGDASPAPKNNGTSLGPRCATLNCALAGNARYISNAACSCESVP